MYEEDVVSVCVCVCVMKYYSATKKELNFAICNNTDGLKERMLTEMSCRERQMLYEILVCGI